jgi:hypothetical protein
MSNNIPILLVGGAALAAGVYFLTKRADPIAAARAARERDVARGGPQLVPVKLDDPPLQGAAVADTCNIERRGDWSKESPRFILSCEGATFTTFDHRRDFSAPAGHANYGSDRCGGRPCQLFRKGTNPNAKYPSDFVETSKGIAAILGTVGTAATNIFQAQSQFDIQKQQLRAGGGGFAPQQPQIIQQPAQSNTTLIAVILIGGLALAGMMFVVLNKKDEATA